ncbi:MAG: hypothetical protein R3A78_05685 [Polyangiales bacterium]
MAPANTHVREDDAFALVEGAAAGAGFGGAGLVDGAGFAPSAGANGSLAGGSLGFVSAGLLSTAVASLLDAALLGAAA